ncbi:MAG: hypothetical protein OK455_00165 [Thaumarchaeota archaeon]|nr:hypothetical protein [Nitrososphaerota archaeon]
MSGLQSRAPFAILVLVALASFATPALAATYTITVQTDMPSYTGSQPIIISGTVTPATGTANTAVILIIKNPIGTEVDIREANVTASTGAYTSLGVAGGSSSWTSGTYSVNATWGGPGGAASQITTFTYSPTATTSTTTTTTTTTSSTTSTTSSTSSSSSSSTTSSTSSTQTTITSPVTVTSSQSSTSSTPTTTSTSHSTTTTQTQSGGLGALTYLIIAVVVVIIAVVGLILWRRKVASDYERKATGTR